MAKKDKFPLRARKTEDKSARREYILDQGLKALQTQDPDSISIESLAQKSGIAKGTIYLYFETKEEVFLGLTGRMLRIWIEDIEKTFARPEQPLPALEFSKRFVGSLRAHPDLTRLLSDLQPVLEKNISDEAALAFKKQLKESMESLAGFLDQKTPALQGPQNIYFLLQSYSLMVGLYQLCNPPPQIRKVIARPELQMFQLDFYEQLTSGITLLLHGIEKSETEKNNSYHLFGNY